MYRYGIYCNEYKDEISYELLHIKKFTLKEFDNMCKQVIEKEMKNDDTQNLLTIKEKLMENYGFTEPDKYVAWRYCGAYGKYK